MAIQNTSDKQILDFEVDRGTKAINLHDIRRLFNFFPYGSQTRVYLLLCFLSLRPSEPMQLTWGNFCNGQLIFRPHKQERKGLLRKIRLPTKVWEELMYYKEHNFFPEPGRLFTFKPEAIRRQFNRKMRAQIGGNWDKMAENYRAGKVLDYHYYTLHSLRTTCATLIYYFYSKAYDHGNLALTLACKFMGHSNEKMTAEYYIKRIDDLGINDFLDLPYLELCDYIIYKDIQSRITEFKEYQSNIIAYEG